MKKLFAVLFVFALLAGSVLPCYAVQFTCTVPKVKSGRDTEVSLSVEQGSALYAAEFVLAYDPDYYEYTEKFAAGDACKALSPLLRVAESEPGTLRIEYSATELLADGGTLCSLGFRAKSDKTGDFRLIVENAATVDGNSIRDLPVTSSVEICGAVDFSCSIPKGKSGKKTDLSLCVDENSNLYTAEFVLTYDPNSYEFTHTSAPGDACKGLSPYLEATQNELGRIKIVYLADQPLTAGGTLCTVGFKPKRSAAQGKFNLTVEHAETFDGTDIRPLLATAGGTVGEIEKSNIIIYFAIATAWAGVILCVLVLVKRKKEKAAKK